MVERRNKIRILAAERNLSVAELAKLSGVQPHNLRRYARQEAQPKIEIANKIAEALNVSLDEVMGTKLGVGSISALPTKIRTIPVFGAVQGGLGQDITDVLAPIDYMPAPEWIAGNPNAYAVIVTGDSMEPRFFAGEILFVHPGLPPKPGDDVVVQLSNGSKSEAVVKRLIRRTASKLICEQFNPPINVEFDAAEVKSVHRIVGAKYT